LHDLLTIYYLGLVIATGMNTQIGAIAKQVSAKKFRNKTALQKR